MTTSPDLIDPPMTVDQPPVDGTTTPPPSDPTTDGTNGGHPNPWTPTNG